MNIRNVGLAVMLSSMLATATMAQGYHSVRGYTRSNGTYVAPHYQTNPDQTRMDNWSTKGNVNPYTGQPGTIDPYRTPHTTAVAPSDRPKGY